MEYVCPICNSLASYIISCDKCGRVMEERGVIQDYFDDYSPYLDKGITEQMDGVSEDRCLHIFTCDHCMKNMRIPIERLKL